MYETLIAALRKVDEYDSGYAKLMYDAADAIEELANNSPKVGKEFGEWIPVTERLPECDLGAEVGNIEWISCGRVYAGCFGRGGKYRDAYFRTWTDAGEGMDAKGADYWRTVTLPEPPEEGMSMGVYISEINMPKGEGSKLILQIFPNGEVYDKHGIRLGIANWAEAIPVPPHGRLIDEDVLIKTAHNQWPLPIDFLKLLELVPTVIPADGKDIKVPTREECE